MIIPDSLLRSIRKEEEALAQNVSFDVAYYHKHAVKQGKNMERVAKKVPPHELSKTLEKVCGIKEDMARRYRFIAREPQVTLYRALQRKRWSITEIASNRNPTDQEREEAEEVCKAQKHLLGYATGGARNGDANDWQTPAEYVDLARKVLKGIDLDPFSSEDANQTVQAKQYLDEHDNALEKEWPKCRSVWMNPPYGARILPAVIEKFCREYKEGTFKTAIVLVNNATETRWLIQLVKCANAILFTDHRIQFETPDHKVSSSNTRGQCFFYFGPDAKSFLAEFSAKGWGVTL